MSSRSLPRRHPANSQACVVDVNGLQPSSPGENSFEDLLTPISNMQGNGLPPPAEVEKEKVDTPVTPRTTPPSTPRRSPSIRIVDAFMRRQ